MTENCVRNIGSSMDAHQVTRRQKIQATLQNYPPIGSLTWEEIFTVKLYDVIEDDFSILHTAD